ncbi:MAG: cadmium-translocating P-type ATPase, partial [Methylophilaceae bacterium]|nr:cadmium-translocating P-type ATPase [Methylophilaceae bacterium]
MQKGEQANQTQYHQAEDKVACFHCGLPVPAGINFSASIFGHSQPMCCRGCQSVAESIVENGLEEYYKHRTELPKTAEDLVPDALRQLALYDHPEVQKSFVLESDGDDKEASLILEGITCAACVWLNERHLSQLAGVRSVNVNYGSQRARVRWNDNQIKLSQILAEINKIGYHAHPFSAQQQDALRQQQRKSDFRRLAVAGLSAGQVMMIAVALYAGPAQGLEFATAQLLRWFSFVLTIPAITYAAWPFYASAWRSIRNRQIGMDVPITLGLMTGFAGSVWATVHGQGVVYFDTLTMLVFFLLGTRYLERNAREKSIEASENLLRLAPVMATKVEGETQTLTPVMELKLGDVILAKPGEAIAADGLVVTGESSVDESLLTGESRPLPKALGAQVFAGSINYESPLTIQVTAIAENTMLAGISRLLDRAQAEKPMLAETADRVATYFTSALLVTVALVALVWWQIQPDRILEIVLTVLVVSCPCALSLAAPAAFAAAGSHLVGRGVLLTRGHALETLAKVTHFVFDKTGTLTQGQLSLVRTITHADFDAEDCLQLAASLEKNSEHALAKAFLNAQGNRLVQLATEVKNIPGQGVEGFVAGLKLRLGNAKLHRTFSADLAQEYLAGATVVWLSDETRLLATFVFADQARQEAKELIQKLKQQGLQVSILSGDSAEAVSHFAKLVGVDDWKAACSPEDKLTHIHALQSQGAVVAMVGDGVNDAPSLAAAEIGVAMGARGTGAALAESDIILMRDRLESFAEAYDLSRRTRRIILQNLVISLGTILVLVVAAMGAMIPLTLGVAGH